MPYAKIVFLYEADMLLFACYGFNSDSFNLQAVPQIKSFAERIFVYTQQLLCKVVEKQHIVYEIAFEHSFRFH